MDVEYPTPGQLDDVKEPFLQIFWPAVNNWVTVNETSTPPAVILSGGPTGSFWRIGGLVPDTQYDLRFEFQCHAGGPCYSGTTDFTTDDSSSSSSSSACPCSGPKPDVVIENMTAIGIRVPTSGMSGVSGPPALQILWQGTWTTVTPVSTPPAIGAYSRKFGDYWSVSGLLPTTTYLFRHVYTCTSGGPCNSDVATGTTTDTPLGCVDGTCPHDD